MKENKYKKKVGIITFHSSVNYGAVLQAYALKEKVSSICSDVGVINYKNKKIHDGLRLIKIDTSGIKVFVRSLASMIFRAKKRSSFNRFLKKRLNLIEYNDKSISECDVLITGSDQVWNNKLTDGDKTYYLDFASNKQKKIAYAASFGDAYVDMDNSYYELIKDFDMISLREENMVESLNKKINKQVQVCCDPSLLLDSKQWDKIANKRLVYKPYLFCFMIDYSDELMKYANKICEEKNLKLINNKNSFEFFVHQSPEDFLSWIKYADCVITNSFHGTVFSIIYHKQFSSMVFESNKTRKRILEILNKLDLVDRIYKKNEENDMEKRENWSKIDSILNDYRTSSFEIMCNSLK